jgi:hypothetical protein
MAAVSEIMTPFMSADYYERLHTTQSPDFEYASKTFRSRRVTLGARLATFKIVASDHYFVPDSETQVQSGGSMDRKCPYFFSIRVAGSETGGDKQGYQTVPFKLLKKALELDMRCQVDAWNPKTNEVYINMDAGIKRKFDDIMSTNLFELFPRLLMTVTAHKVALGSCTGAKAHPPRVRYILKDVSVLPVEAKPTWLIDDNPVAAKSTSEIKKVSKRRSLPHETAAAKSPKKKYQKRTVLDFARKADTQPPPCDDDEEMCYGQGMVPPESAGVVDDFNYGESFLT